MIQSTWTLVQYLLWWDMREESLSHKLEINIILDYKLGEELAKGEITGKLEA